MSLVAETHTKRNLDDPKILLSHLQRTQPETFASFHDNQPKILVLDDNPRTLARIGRDLGILYGDNVKTVSDPEYALKLIREAKASGVPYDVLVTDLDMPGKTGMEVTKELGRDAPGVVWYTASSMDYALADYSIQMSKYRGDNAVRLITSHQVDHRPAEMPMAAVFMASKDGTLSNLVNQINAAQMVHRYQPELAENIPNFVDSYQPKLIKREQVILNVHGALEDIRNAVKVIEPIVDDLRSNHGLENTQWWGVNGSNLLDALQILKASTFHTVNMSNEAQAFSAIHSLLGEFCNLSPAGLSYQEGSQAEQLVNRWYDAFDENKKHASVAGEKLRAFSHGYVDLNDRVKEKCLELGFDFFDHSLIQEYPLLHDEHQLVSGLVSDSITAFRRFIDQNAPEAFTDISLSFHLGREECFSSDLNRRKAQTINAEDYYQLKFTVDRDLKLEDAFTGLAAKLANLRMSNKITCFSTPGDFDEFIDFSIIIKVNESQTGSGEILAKIEADASSPDQVITQLEDQKDVKIYKRENVTSIGSLPLEVDYNCSTGKARNAAGLVFEHKGEQYFAIGSSHKEAAQVISAFLRLQKIAEDFSANQIYEAGVRVTIIGNSGIYVEPETQITKSEQAKAALITLGAIDQRVLIDKKLFLAPKAISRPGDPILQTELSGMINRTILASFLELPQGEMANSTICDYVRIALNQENVEDPSFTVRTLDSLSLSQQKELADYFEKLLSHLGEAAFGICQVNGRYMLDTNGFMRKSGIFLFEPEGTQPEELYSKCKFSQMLSPFVGGSTSSRLRSEKVIKAGDACIPKNSLVYVGGDHTIGGALEQLQIACVLELALQKMGITYDVCRGNLNNLGYFHSFDGQKLTKSDSIIF